MSGLSNKGLILVLSLSALAFVIIIIIVIILLLRRRCNSQDVETNFGGVSESSVPVHTIRNDKRPHTVYSIHRLHTPPRFKRRIVRTSRTSKHYVYNLDSQQGRYHLKSDHVVGQRITQKENGEITRHSASQHSMPARSSVYSTSKYTSAKI